MSNDPQDLPAVSGDTRRERMVRWILEHSELDFPATKGKLTFDLGRQAGTGRLAVAVSFHAVAEDI